MTKLETFISNNPHLAAVATIENNDFVNSLIGSIEKYGSLTERQMSALERVISFHNKPVPVSTSQHVGSVGARMEFKVKVERVVFIGLVKNGWYSHANKYLYIFVDENGNTLKWFTTGGGAIDKGDELVIKGTVKGFDEYKGVKQTTLTRCKVVSSTPAKVEEAA